jgi:hypothetical protein
VSEPILNMGVQCKDETPSYALSLFLSIYLEGGTCQHALEQLHLVRDR